MEKQSTRKFLKLFVALVALFLLGASALLLAACQDEPAPEEPHVHSFTEEVTLQPTCNAQGSKTFTCSCGYKYSEPIAATGDHQWEDVKVYPASCESEGWTVRQCKTCGLQQDYNFTQIRGHKYALNTKESHPATCTQAGVEIWDCEYCGDRYIDAQYTADNQATGHKWIENTDAEETEFWGVVDAADANKEFTVTTSTGEKLTYENLAEAKADGWTVSTEAMCSTDGTLSRVCDRCGETETVTIEAPGHKLDETIAETNKWFVCKAQDNLTDVDGNKYAYICANGDHCDAKVTIDAEGTTAHYVAPVAHNYINEDGTEVEWTNNTATCTTDGKEERDCVECGDTAYRNVAALGHDKNTVQMDGKTPVLICDEDPALDGKDAGLNALASVLMQKCDDDPVKYAEEYPRLSAAYTKYFVTEAAQHKRGPAYYCFRCHTFIEAMDHEYVYAALEEGKFDESDYQKDENGKPVEAEITEAEFTCQYVKVCKNCGTTDGKGDHGEATTATCRSGSYCTLCGEQRGGQLYHKYVNMSDILDTKNEANKKVGNTDYTYGELRTAYEKVSATQAWMTPDAGQCDKPGKDVAVCITCLLDAADGAEFDWAPKAVETENEFNEAIKVANNQSVSAYTYEYDAKHSYVVAYYTTDAKAWTDGYVNANQHAGRILWQNTNCLFGYKVAYICEDCGKVYKNVPTLDVTGGTDESANNTDLGHGYTDENGFILVADGTQVGGATVDYDKNLTTMPSVDTHKEVEHAVYVNDNYKTNGYLAPNCVDAAMIPYFCANCGQKIVVEYGDDTAPIDTETFTEGEEIDTTNFNGDPIVTKNTVDGEDKKVNPENHKNDTFECGEHCNAYVLDKDGKKLYCSAFDTTSPAGSETTVEIADDDARLTEAYHDTIIVEFGFSTLVIYDEGYTLKIATVTKDNVSSTANDDSEYEVDWENVKLSATDKASECMKTGAGSNNYTLPTKFTAITDYAGFTGGKYFVVVDAEGKIYPIEDELYIFSHDDTGNVDDPITGSVNVTQGDKFFIRFSNVANKPAALPNVPVKAADAASLEFAFDKNPIENTGTADAPVYTLTVDMAADKVVTLEDDQTLSGLIDQKRTVSEEGNDTVDKIVVNMNGSKITQSAVGSFTSTVDVTFVGGELEFTVDRGEVIPGTKPEKKTSEASCMLVVAPQEGAKLTLDGMTITTENTSAILVQQPNNVDPEGSSGGEVVIKNSKIVSGGSYGVGTNATKAVAEQDELKITIENTDISFTTAKDADPVPQNALFVNVPSTVKVKGSTFSANYLPVLVRGGDVTIVNSTLNLLNTYTEDSVEDQMAAWLEEEDNSGKTEAEAWAAVVGGETKISTIKNWADGLTLQQYRMAGLWKTGIAVSRAVITIGNNSTTSYQYKTNVTLGEDVQLINETLDAVNAADRMPTVVIASNFAKDTYMVEGVVQVMVTVTAEEEVLGTPEYCSNWIAGTVMVNNKLVTK